MMRKLLNAALCVILSVGQLMAQDITVSGRITNAKTGETLPGVNVQEVGTTRGSITDIDGRYSLSVPSNASLRFSFIGFVNQTIQVNGRSVINVTLVEDVTELSEIVIVGYGAIEARDATGAVERINAKEFNQGVIASPEQLIQGKSAGVQVTTASGEPGAGVNIRIRGSSSVRANNNPLFVIDGIPLAGNDVTAGGPDLGAGSSSPRNPLNFLNPNDIESIDILKDASATAIYGARGANGVVLITTKGGRGLGKTLTYDANISIARPQNRFDLLNREDFLGNVGRFGADPNELDFGNNTDWQNEIYNTAISTKHDLAYGDSYKTGSYRVSLGYENMDGVIKNSSMERLTGRVNWNQKFLNDRLNFNTQATISRINDEFAPITDNAGFQGDLLGSAYLANPTLPADPENQIAGFINPLSLLKYNQDNAQTDRILLNFSLDYDITSDLNFRVNVGFDRASSVRSTAASRDLIIGSGITGNGRTSITSIDNSSDLLEAFLTYEKSFGNSKVNILGGYSYQNFKITGYGVNGWGFNTSDMNEMISQTNTAADRVRSAITGNYQQFGFNPEREIFFTNQFGTAPTLGTVGNIPVRAVTENIFGNQNELQSFFGRVNYALHDKYLFTATLRADGSTRFGGDNKYGVFPSAAFAWRISDEGFLPEAVSDLKFRIAYGVTGNQEIPHNVHQRRQAFTGIGIQDNGNIVRPGLSTVAFENRNLRWEQTAMTNLGFDFGFANNRLTGMIDAYYKNTTDLLFQVISAQPAPQPFTWENLDTDVINQGIELTMNYIVIDRPEFTWSFGYNVAYNHNRVRGLVGSYDTGAISGQGLTGAFAQRIQDGEPLFAFFLRDFVGFNEQGLTEYGLGDFQTFLGVNTIPVWNYGINTMASYKNWDFAIFMNGQGGHHVYNNTANAFFTAGAFGNGRNVTRDVLTSGESPINNPDVSSRFLERADFLRMQNLSVGYNFNLENSRTFKNLRLTANAQNLFVLTPYTGLDPEVNVNKAIGGIPSFGIDYTAFPRPTTITIGLNATF
ncbi:MAG: SusC/RagA family TonB-linked outer membrane protein [Cyclobacteriaceae bacterium]|nr:SusC/RagA family TonB-linked outer membrane protein [Cyclobacteriaceae bacterium]